MSRRILSKLLTTISAFVFVAAFCTAESQAGWYPRRQRGDCDGGLTYSQMKATTACDLARARRLSDLSCLELSRIAEADRQVANLRALAGYQRATMGISHPGR